MNTRNHLINIGRRRAETETRVTFKWAGSEYPCSAGPLSKASALSSDGGGFSLFDDAWVELRTELFQKNVFPQENEPCELRMAQGMPWRSMKVKIVDLEPGGAIIVLHLNALAQGA